jgi:hypothetical protein
MRLFPIIYGILVKKIIIYKPSSNHDYKTDKIIVISQKNPCDVNFNIPDRLVLNEVIKSSKSHDLTFG